MSKVVKRGYSPNDQRLGLVRASSSEESIRIRKSKELLWKLLYQIHYY
ncbi:MAG: hypothetical protein ACI4GD_05515 [Lachnospiraceae bacterium]